MGALIFGVMFFLMILGVPIAFSISLSSTAYLMASGNNLVLLAQRLFLGMDSFVLLAVPLFVLTGYLMEQCGLSQRLIDWVECIFGRIPGSAGIVTIISCAIFAALTGSGQVTIAAIGALTLPALLKKRLQKGNVGGHDRLRWRFGTHYSAQCWNDRLWYNDEPEHSQNVYVRNCSRLVDGSWPADR